MTDVVSPTTTAEPSLSALHRDQRIWLENRLRRRLGNADDGISRVRGRACPFPCFLRFTQPLVTMASDFQFYGETVCCAVGC